MLKRRVPEACINLAKNLVHLNIVYWKDEIHSRKKLKAMTAL